MYKKNFSVLFLLVTFYSCFVFAQEKSEEGIPESLDYDKRNAWRTYNEIYIYGGNYFGDSLRNSFLTGGEYVFHISKSFGVGASFGYSRADYNENVNYSQAGFFTKKDIYILDAIGMISFPVAIKMGGSVVLSDLYLSFGGGTININEFYKPHGLVGGGMRIFFNKPWFCLRVGIRTTFHSTEKPGGSEEFDQDMLLLIGLSFQIPPRIL